MEMFLLFIRPQFHVIRRRAARAAYAHKINVRDDLLRYMNVVRRPRAPEGLNGPLKIRQCWSRDTSLHINNTPN